MNAIPAISAIKKKPQKKRVISSRDELLQIISKRAGRDLETSTLERVLQDGGELTIAEDGKRQLVHQSIIDRLFSRKKLTKRMYDAGDKLRNDLAEAQLDGTFGRVDLERTAPPERDAAAVLSGHVTDAVLAARHRYRAAVSAVGVRLFPIVEYAVLVAPPGVTMAEIGTKFFGRKSGKAGGASALEVLRIALDQLADHYFGADNQALRGHFFWWRPGLERR